MSRDEQAIWDAYRQHPDHSAILQAAGVGGPEDLDAALESEYLLNADDPEDLRESGPLYVKDHVLHTLTVFAGERSRWVQSS